MDRTPSPKRRHRSPSPTSKSRVNHSPVAVHVSAEAIRNTLNDIGVDQSDVKQIDEIFKTKNVPSHTRKIKETTFETLVNLNEKWNRHKKKTAEIIKETKKRDIQHRETAINLKKKINGLSTENESYKTQIRRLELNINELQSIEKEQSKDREEKDALKEEIRRLKTENDSLRQSKIRYHEKNKGLEGDKRKVELDNKKLREAYNKQEQFKHQLERDLRETKTELEMFEDMLKKIPQQLDDSLSDFSDFDQPPSPVGNYGQNRNFPSASHAISNPVSSSTPMVTSSSRPPISKLSEKVSMTTNLLKLSGELQDMAADAKVMKEQDEALRSLIFDDSN